MATTLTKIQIVEIYRTHHKLQTYSIPAFYTARFRFDRLLLLGRGESGTSLPTLEAYASSKTSSPCQKLLCYFLKS